MSARSSKLGLVVACCALAACEKSPDATSTNVAPRSAEPGSPASSPPPVTVRSASSATLTPVAKSGLTVTHGAVTAGEAEMVHVRDPEVRAIAREASSDDATLRFSYLGPTDRSAPLASGELRRQVGLKLRAKDGCNLIYVMWRLEPKAELVVSVKENPGKRTHADCGTHGYRNVAGDAPLRVPPIAVGEVHSLGAHLEGERLSVTIDRGAPVNYALGAVAAELRGPVGFRTDNASVDLTLLVGPSSGTSAETPEDD